MSLKSIILSILSILLMFGAVFMIAYAFSAGILYGILAILLIIIPAVVERKALHEADGIIDKFIAKYVVLIFWIVAVVAGIFGAGYLFELFN